MRLHSWTAALLFAFATAGSSLIIGMGTADAEVRSNVRYSGYAVRGINPADIWSDIVRRGPHQRERGLYAQAEAQVRFDWNANYASSREGCRVQAAVVSVDVNIVLPSWVDEGRASPALRTAWSRYIAEVRRHEERHKDIAVAAAREMERAIRAAPPQRSCADVQRYIAAQIHQVRQKERGQQLQFDRTAARIVLAGGR